MWRLAALCLTVSVLVLCCVGCKSTKKKSGDMMFLGNNDWVGFDMDNDGDFNKTRNSREN